METILTSSGNSHTFFIEARALAGVLSGNDVNRIAICSVVICFLYIRVDGAVVGLDIYVFNAGYVYLGLVVINREVEEA